MKSQKDGYERNSGFPKNACYHVVTTNDRGDGMDAPELKHYDLEVALTGYMPIPRELLGMNLPSTALLVYGALLDRATLSQKNHYADESSWVYVIYPVERLAETICISDTAVKRHLRELEGKGLIHRDRQVRNGPNHIYLNLPATSIKAPAGGTNCPDQIHKRPGSTGRKVPPNNRRKQHDFSNYYQHGEEESL